MEMTPEIIGQRYEALTSQRKTIEQTWQWIERYVVPFRGKFFRPQTSEHEIEWSQRIIFDDTAIDAAKTLAASIHGALTNPSFQFFSLTFRKDELNNNSEAAEWLEECGERVYQALIDSNFGLEINEAYIDLTSFGTACIIEEAEEDEGEFKGLNFQAAPIREAYFEEDHKGQPLRFYRLYQWLPLQIVDKFGKEKGTYVMHADTEHGHPDPGFMVMAYRQGPKKAAPPSPHDHGACFVVYGVAAGSNLQTRYRWTYGEDSTQPPVLEKTQDILQKPGDAAYFLPGEIHSTQGSTEEETVYVRVTSQNLDDAWRHRYHLGDNKTTVVRSATQPQTQV